MIHFSQLRTLAATTSLGAILFLSGCASTQPVGGFIYSNVKGPVAATSTPRGPLTGEACATSYLGMVALGDASITAAAKAGGVVSISNVDQHSTSILGLITTYCTQVWGHKNASKTATATGMGPAAATRPAAAPAPAGDVGP